MQADENPEIYVTNLRINGIENNEIKGEFTVWNNENYYLSDLNYEIKFFSITTSKKFVSIDELIPNETFFVSPNATTTKSFAYKYPKNINDGDYTLRLQIATQRGTELGWEDQIISLKGENKFLEIIPDSPKLLVDGKESASLHGVNVNPKAKITASFKIKNPGEKITIVPKIKIYQRQINMPLIKDYQDASITFAKGETKEINLKMPELNTPESYLTEIIFYNNNEQVSGTQFFRWVVEGESGKILNIKADKDYFKAGENINLTIDSIGPADASDLGMGNLKVTVFDKNGNIISTISKDVKLNFDLVSSVISIPVKKDLISPKIKAELTKDGKVLDERTINLPIFSDQAKQIEKNQLFKKYLIYLLLVILAITILVIGFFGLKSKFRKD